MALQLQLFLLCSVMLLHLVFIIFQMHACLWGPSSCATLSPFLFVSSPTPPPPFLSLILLIFYLLLFLRSGSLLLNCCSDLTPTWPKRGNGENRDHQSETVELVFMSSFEFSFTVYDQPCHMICLHSRLCLKPDLSFLSLLFCSVFTPLAPHARPSVSFFIPSYSPNWPEWVKGQFVIL